MSVIFFGLSPKIGGCAGLAWATCSRVVKTRVF